MHFEVSIKKNYKCTYNHNCITISNILNILIKCIIIIVTFFFLLILLNKDSATIWSLAELS